MPIANETSKRIIKSWFNRSINPIKFPGYDHFDRFISLWISFNGFFVSKHYNEAKNLQDHMYGGGEPSEKIYIDLLGRNNNYNLIYDELINTSTSFNNNLELFIDLLKYNRIPGAISDLRPNRFNERNAAYFRNRNSLKQFLNVIYQIRCNLFHGNKNPGSESDKEIVKTSFDLLLEFVKQIYEQEHLI